MRKLSVVLMLMVLLGTSGWSATTSEYANNRLEFFDNATFERVLPVAPLVFVEEFLGYQLMLSESGSTGRWQDVVVGGSTTLALAADEANGAAALTFNATPEAEDAVLYWGDQRGIDLENGCVWECRATAAVLPSTGVSLVLGMAGDHNLDKDAVTEAAWFKVAGAAAGSGTLLTESDDTTNNNDDTATGITIVAGTYNIFRIDFTDLEDVRFYVDGVSVALATTFDMSNLSSSEAVMQPYFSLDKAAVNGAGTLKVDYVRIWTNRE